MKKKLYIESTFLIFLGIATSLSLPPLNFWIINFFVFTSFFIFLTKKANQHKNKKFFFFYGWLFGFGYFLSNLYWISISLTFDQNFKFLIPVTIILIPAFLSLFYGLITFFFIIIKHKNYLSSLLIFSLIFGIFEFIRGSILTGFPWNLVVYSLSNQLEILSITSIIGTYGLNLFCISLFTCPALLILKRTKVNLFACIFLSTIAIFFYIFGLSYEKKFNSIKKEKYDYKIRIIGSNISLDRFYHNIDTVSIIKDLIKISKPDKNEKTIFVWPEGIISNINEGDLSEYKWLFEEKFNQNHLFIMGITNKYEKNGFIDYFNSFSIFDHKLKILNNYNKINLVPFGEFLPLESFLSNLGLKSLTNNYQSFSSGVKRDIIKLSKKDFSINILPLICYEIIYPGKLFNNYNFDLIINISEDGWFGQSVGPKQHFVHSIFRAIESGKYVARSSNNGIAAIVNSIGQTQKSVKFGQSGYVDLKDYKKIQPTIFSKYGNKTFGLLILLYIFLIFSFNKIRDE